MNVDSILVSDHASIDAAGKLSVVGAFNNISAKDFPATHAVMSISLVIHAHQSEAGTEHPLSIDLLNASRESILSSPITTMVALPQEPDGGWPPGMPIRYVVTRRLFGIQFPDAGPYAFEVEIDGTYHAAATLYLTRAG